MTTNEINLLSAKLGNITNETINQYTQWYFISATSWFVFGLLITVLCVKLFKYCRENGDELIAAIWVCSLGLGLVLIFANVADLICPRAYAIHQLLNDIIP